MSADPYYATPLLLQSLDGGHVTARVRLGDLPRQFAAGREVDAHAEEVRRRLRQDLREAGRVLGVVAGDHVGPARALEEDDRLHEVGVDAAPGDGVLDHGAKRGRATRRGHDSAKALGEEDVTEPERGGPFVRGSSTGLVRERVRSHDLTRKRKWRMSLLVARHRVQRHGDTSCQDGGDESG